MANEDLLVEYAGNDMKKLRTVTNKLLANFGITQTGDFDNFYSIANECLWKACETFNKEENDNFYTFLCNCLVKKIQTEIRDRQRDKRRINYEEMLSLDYEYSENADLQDLLASDYSLENEVFEEHKDDKAKLFLDKLSNLERKVIVMLADGYSPLEIKKHLGITSQVYEACLKEARRFENYKILL